MTKRCTALFHHGWADWEAGSVLAALREYFGFEVRIATPDAAAVASIGGVRAAADLAFADAAAEDIDLLLVIGSDSWASEDNPEVVELLRRTNAAGKPIGAICAGTLVAARAGLLESRAHTSNSLEFLRQAAGYGGTARYVETPRAVSDGGVVTAPGSAPGSFSLAVLRLVVPDQGEAIDGYAKMLAAEYRD